MTVSIILPVYNVSKYVGRCLDSIFSQECEEADIECIVVNDCTPDDSMDLVAEKLREYKGNIAFRVLAHETNQGLSVARNTGIVAARGEFVFFVDSDDTLEPNTIQYLLKGLHDTGDSQKVDLVMANAYMCQDKMNGMTQEGDVPQLIDNSDEEALRKMLTRSVMHTAWNKLVRKKFLTDHGLFFEPGIIHEDALWSYLVFLHASQVLVMPKVTYIYCDNPTSIVNTRAERISHRIHSQIVICNKMLDAPPRQSFREYFVFIFFVLTLACEHLMRYGKSVEGQRDAFLGVRNRFLKQTWKRGHCLLWLYFLTLVRPFCLVLKCGWYRRHYDKITGAVLSMSRAVGL